MAIQKDYFIKFGGVVFLVIIGLFLIRVFNISYPVKVDLISSERTSEFAVIGEGKIDVVPDTAYISTGIKVEGEKSVKDVTQKIDKTNNEIIKSIKGLGIEKEDIKTSQYSITPQYDSPERGSTSISGYNGSVSISIKLKDINKISNVIERITSAGANEVSGVVFDIDKPEEARKKARDKAIENAKKQAKELSNNLGIKLGKIVNLVESSSSRIPNYSAKGLSMDAVSEQAPVIEPGTQTVTSIVTLYFEKK